MSSVLPGESYRPQSCSALAGSTRVHVFREERRSRSPPSCMHCILGSPWRGYWGFRSELRRSVLFLVPPRDSQVTCWHPFGTQKRWDAVWSEALGGPKDCSCSCWWVIVSIIYVRQGCMMHVCGTCSLQTEWLWAVHVNHRTERGHEENVVSAVTFSFT